eukprot:g25.t1
MHGFLESKSAHLSLWRNRYFFYEGRNSSARVLKWAATFDSRRPTKWKGAIVVEHVSKIPDRPSKRENRFDVAGSDDRGQPLRLQLAAHTKEELGRWFAALEEDHQTKGIEEHPRQREFERQLRKVVEPGTGDPTGLDVGKYRDVVNMDVHGWDMTPQQKLTARGTARASTWYPEWCRQMDRSDGVLVVVTDVYCQKLAEGAWQQALEGTGDKRDAVKARFNAMDKDKDGVLNLEEFVEGVVAHNRMSKREATDLFNDLDKDGNGVVDFPEFMLCAALEVLQKHAVDHHNRRRLSVQAFNNRKTFGPERERLLLEAKYILQRMGRDASFKVFVFHPENHHHGKKHNNQHESTQQSSTPQTFSDQPRTRSVAMGW